MRLILVMITLGLVACAPGAVELTVDGLPAPASDADHATEAYRFSQVDAEIWCERSDEYDVCVVEIHADDGNSYGESRSLSFEWPATEGDLDLASVPVGYDPAIYAHTDDVQGEHRSFDWRCRWAGGTASLDSAPSPGEQLTGQFDLRVDCTDDLGGQAAVDVRLHGELDVVPTGATVQDSP